MTFRAVVAVSLALSLVLPVQARAEISSPVQRVGSEVAADVAMLIETMRIGEVMDAVRAEGLDYGDTLEAEMFPDRGGMDWRHAVGLIYDTRRMEQRFTSVLNDQLSGDPATIKAAQEFFAGDLGQRILTLEIEARRALMDDAVEEAAKVRVDEMIAAHDPRMEALRRYAETNDLVESNVVGALNANLAFYRGLAEGGTFGQGMPEDEMLAEVWSQEDEVRADTESWLFSFIALAYQPLSDEELASYQAMSETKAGQRLNSALFAAFDAVFTDISRELGLAAARQMQGEDI